MVRDGAAVVLAGSRRSRTKVVRLVEYHCQDAAQWQKKLMTSVHCTALTLIVVRDASSGKESEAARSGTLASRTVEAGLGPLTSLCDPLLVTHSVIFLVGGRCSVSLSVVIGGWCGWPHVSSTKPGQQWGGLELQSS